MSSTRHAPQGSAVSYERYMSSPEYMELRGIPGTAVAAKAQLDINAHTRSLLFFLQSLSIKGDGLRFVARALLERLPSSPTHRPKRRVLRWPGRKLCTGDACLPA